jgi:uncharacterized membrane protein YhaH (DUF805 family)
MNEPNDFEAPNQPGPDPNPDFTPQPPPVAFCQHCGKPLTTESVRRVGPAVYCEPCLAARLHGAPPIPGAPPPAYGPVNAGRPTGAPGSANPFPGSEPNPGLAALLGLIPGVGAMYNEQYAKGIVHLLIFAILVSFSHAFSLFGLFCFGWICYMSIEAHHTAKARRDGTPLPNPFGFNDIGERMGFGKGWTSGPDVAAAARDAAAAAAAGLGAAAAGFSQRPATGTPPKTTTAAPPWGAPVDAYPPNPMADPGFHAAWNQKLAQDMGMPYTAPPYGTGQPYGAPVPPYTPPTYTPVNPVPPFSPGYMPPAGLPRNRFPMGAVWLIALGMIFLLGTLGIFNAVPGTALVGVVLLILGAFIFLRRMLDTGESFTYDGTFAYRLRVLRALRVSIWLIVIGFFVLLDSFRLVGWAYLWPWLIILVGAMMLLQRAVYNSAASSAAYAAASAPPTQPVSVPQSEPIITPPPASEPGSREGGV